MPTGASWVSAYPCLSRNGRCYRREPGVWAPRLAPWALTVVSAWRAICSTVCHARYPVPMPRDRGSDLGGMLHLACSAVRDDLGRDARYLCGCRRLPGGGPSCGRGEEWARKPLAAAAMKTERGRCCRCDQKTASRDGEAADGRPRYRCLNGRCGDTWTRGHLGEAWDTRPASTRTARADGKS